MGKDTASATVRDILFAVGFYWIVSIALVFLNKLVMSGNLELDAPLFLTWTQIVIAVLSCYIMAKAKPYVQYLSFFPRFEYIPSVGAKVMPLTLVFLGMIIFNNLCLKYVQVSFYQVARSLTIVFNVILTYFLLNQRTSNRSLVAVGIVISGYLLGCEGELDFSFIGVFYGISASFFVAMYSIYVKQTLKYVGDDSWKLMIYNNINAMILMPFLFLLAGEYSQLKTSYVFEEMYFWNVIILTGLFGFLINIATFLQIQTTTPLTHNVSGTAKSGFQTMLAYMITGNQFTLSSVFGNILVLGGSLLYAYIRMKEAESKKPFGFEKVPSENTEKVQDLEANAST